MGTEASLLVFSVVWALMVAIPLLMFIWLKYTAWILKNFGQEKE